MELAMANHQIRGCLTTEQALRDFAVIIQSLKANLSSAFSPVIVMGTGYGGALATWFRLTYPEIAIGALASSTPMYYFGNATQQHDGYCSIVSQNFKDANENCYKSIRESWKKIDKIASEPNGLAKLGTTFNTCRPLESKVEIKDMLAQVYSYIAITNDPMDDHLNAFCYTIERGTIEGILLAVLPLLKLPGDCLNTVVTEVNSPFEPFSNWTVAWAWQRCSELIYPLGCREDTMLPSKPFDMTKFKQACHERFGVVPQPRTPISFFARKSLIDSLVGFGGNIIFSNGHRDPLSSAGILEDLSSTITAITTKRGTYASDMVLAISDINPAWLRNQREEEMKILRRWINYYNHVKGSHFSVSYRIAYLVLGVILGFIAIVFVASTIIGYNIFRSLYSPV